MRLETAAGSRRVKSAAWSDNAWAAFTVEPPLVADAAELRGEGDSPVSPWVTAEGWRSADGRRRRGAVVARSFHEAYVPPAFPPLEGGPAIATPGPHPVRLGDRWRTAVTFAGLVARHAAYLVRSEGPYRGGRRVAGGAWRRARSRLARGR